MRSHLLPDGYNHENMGKTGKSGLRGVLEQWNIAVLKGTDPFCTLNTVAYA